jgi:hypothetical protein
MVTLFGYHIQITMIQAFMHAEKIWSQLFGEASYLSAIFSDRDPQQI